MINASMTVFIKEGNKWNLSNVVSDQAEVYKSLSEDFLHKKIHKCSYITSIKDLCNYDGTRTITTYYNNGVKRVYRIED